MADVVEKRTELFFQEGSSDKLYCAELIVHDDGSCTVKVEWVQSLMAVWHSLWLVKILLVIMHGCISIGCSIHLRERQMSSLILVPILIKGQLWV